MKSTRTRWPVVFVGMLLLTWLTAVPVFAEQTPEPMAWLADILMERGLALGLLLVLIGGMALNLTPCVYPLIPITLAFFTSQSEGKVRHTLALAVAYVLGLSLTYAILGIVAAKTGALLGSWLQAPIVRILLSLAIVALASSMFGLYELRVPQAFTRRFSRAATGLGGAFVMGLVVGILAAPCIGPFVLGLFIFVSQFANVVTGFLVFFTLGVGMGLPYIALALVVNRMARVPKIGPWLVWIKQALGLVLVGLALYFVYPLLPEHAMYVATALLLLGAGLYLGWFARIDGQTRRLKPVRRAVGAALLVAAVIGFWPRPASTPGIAWQPFTTEAVEAARVSHQPVVVDIFADWCLPCVELDHVTFRHPEVVAAMAPMAALRLDVTDGIPEHAAAFVDDHRVYGVPTVLLIDATGTERTTLRVLGFIRPREMLDRLSQLQ